MTDHFTEDDVLAAIPRLTRVQLFTFLEARIVVPFHTETGLVYRPVDIARMELLCDLTEDLELGADSLSVVMSLIDQLHTARRDLRVIINAIAVQPPEVKARIAATVNGA
jgi:chaperone modulatory protein CbpM